MSTYAESQTSYQPLLLEPLPAAGCKPRCASRGIWMSSRGPFDCQELQEFGIGHWHQMRNKMANTSLSSNWLLEAMSIRSRYLTSMSHLDLHIGPVVYSVKKTAYWWYAMQDSFLSGAVCLHEWIWDRSRVLGIQFYFLETVCFTTFMHSVHEIRDRGSRNNSGGCYTWGIFSHRNAK